MSESRQQIIDEGLTIRYQQMEIERLREQLAAWEARFPQYEYRAQDDCVALKMETK